MKNMEWEIISEILSSSYKLKIIKELSKGPKTPSMISKTTGIYISHVSSILSRFVKLGLVTCITPSRKKGKIYVLTKKGEELVNTLKQLNILENKHD